MDDILFEISGGILRVMLNRPARKNAMTNDMYARFADALRLAQPGNSEHVVLAVEHHAAECRARHVYLVRQCADQCQCLLAIMIYDGIDDFLDSLIGHPAVLDLRSGLGHVIAFNFNPLHRDLNRGDQRMLWNAIINWRAILAER